MNKFQLVNGRDANFMGCTKQGCNDKGSSKTLSTKQIETSICDTAYVYINKVGTSHYLETCKC